MIRFWFVDDHRDAHEVKRMCTVLGIGRSSYYKWRAGKAARQARQEAMRRWWTEYVPTTKNGTTRWATGG